MTEVPLLAVRDLHVAYGAVEAVAGVSLTVPAGAIVSVIGPNGAGKSTLLNALMGLQPSRGAILFDGLDITALPTEARLVRGLCLVAEKRELFSDMSVADNLALGAYTRRHAPRHEVEADLDAAYDRFPRLRERRGQLAGTLSGGERQMLAIARALMARPRLLMLDEPSLGLAPLVVAEVLATVAALRDAGVSILVVEQNARAVLRIADTGTVLENGKVVISGPAAQLMTDQRLIDAYLGLAPPSEPAYALPPGAA